MLPDPLAADPTPAAPESDEPQVLRVLRGHTAPVRAVIALQQWVFSASEDGEPPKEPPSPR